MVTGSLMNNNLEQNHKNNAKELVSLFRTGDICESDILRHLKEVERQTAKFCAEMIKENASLLYAHELFDGKAMSAQEFADKTQRDILNTFLS